MTKPIVALVTDANGDHYIRVAGDVTVVWVDEGMPHDRVFEIRRREAPERLKNYLGDESEWGHANDDRQAVFEHALHVSRGGLKN